MFCGSCVGLHRPFRRRTLWVELARGQLNPRRAPNCMENPLLSCQQGAFLVEYATDGGTSAGAQLAARREKSERGEGEAPTVRAGAENYTIGSCWPLILR